MAKRKKRKHPLFDDLQRLVGRVFEVEQELRDVKAYPIQAFATIEKLATRLAALQEVLSHPTYAVNMKDRNGKIRVLAIEAVAHFAGNVLITVGRLPK